MGGSTNKEANNKNEQKKSKVVTRSRSGRISFSAKLPSDVCGEWADHTICAVLSSTDPFLDLQASIIEMVRQFGVRDWDDMEELVYCYIALNSSEVHSFIIHAFLSLFT
ncbi:hypothetical protein RND81_05G052600 [Saponaria officinalis]|uniref:Transcription repressor n=1 Tax=Saponaria officinalis TaxID=3572 RepID=A0AAW1KQY4_SAPOF